MTAPKSPGPKKPDKRVTAKRPVRQPKRRPERSASATTSHAKKPSPKKPARASKSPTGDRAPRTGARRKATGARRPAGSGRAKRDLADSNPTPAVARERAVSTAQSTHAARRRLTRATAFLALPALIATFFLVLHTSLFAVASVAVAGEHETPASAIVAIAGLNSRPPLIDVNPAAVAARIESLPWIKTAVVVRHWPKSVAIRVTERTPVAEASIRRHRWELFDSVGRALGFTTLRSSGLVRLREVAPMPSPGAVASAGLGDEIALADALPLALVPQVREVTSSPSGDLSVVLSTGPEVIFGSATALADKVVALSTLLADHVSLVGVTSINVSVPSSPVLGSAPAVTKSPVRSVKRSPTPASTTPSNG